MPDVAAAPADIAALLAVIKALQQENEYLRLQLAKARRERFGRSSERGGELLAQLPLLLGDGAPAATHASNTDAKTSPSTKMARTSRRLSQPEFLPREEQRLSANDSCGCPACGGALKLLGEDVSETLEFVPASFKVIRTVRPKLGKRLPSTVLTAGR